MHAFLKRKMDPDSLSGSIFYIDILFLHVSIVANPEANSTAKDEDASASQKEMYLSGTILVLRPNLNGDGVYRTKHCPVANAVTQLVRCHLLDFQDRLTLLEASPVQLPEVFHQASIQLPH